MTLIVSTSKICSLGLGEVCSLSKYGNSSAMVKFLKWRALYKWLISNPSLTPWTASTATAQNHWLIPLISDTGRTYPGCTSPPWHSLPSALPHDCHLRNTGSGLAASGRHGCKCTHLVAERVAGNSRCTTGGRDQDFRDSSHRPFRG